MPADKLTASQMRLREPGSSELRARDHGNGTGAAHGLGPRTGLLPRDHLTVESALQVDLSRESVRRFLKKTSASPGAR